MGRQTLKIVYNEKGVSMDGIESTIIHDVVHIEPTELILYIVISSCADDCVVTREINASIIKRIEVVI